MDLNKWQQLNANVWQRVYACGTVGIVRRFSREKYACYTIEPSGDVRDSPLGYGVDHFGTEAAMKGALDKKYDPQPDTILGGEKEGCDWTIYRHGTRVAIIRPYSDNRDTWFIADGAGEIVGPSRMSLSKAEEIAKSYVLGN